MEPAAVIEDFLARTLAEGTAQGCPPRLAEAMHYAVFPGGHRVRPRLCLAVAAACGDGGSTTVLTATTAAVAIELLHCASLVHDDLPCFDDAAFRRGKPSVHRVYGDALALLTGDALIVLAFQALGDLAQVQPARAGMLSRIVGRGVGAASGAVGGQAWECESAAPLGDYHRAKTGALFAAATMAGAAAAGVAHEPWALLGERIGEAYQVADDLLDCGGDPALMGKPVGRDASLHRPNAAALLGPEAARERLVALIAEATAVVPAAAQRDRLCRQLEAESLTFLQLALERRAAA